MIEENMDFRSLSYDQHGNHVVQVQFCDFFFIFLVILLTKVFVM